MVIYVLFIREYRIINQTKIDSDSLAYTICGPIHHDAEVF